MGVRGVSWKGRTTKKDAPLRGLYRQCGVYFTPQEFDLLTHNCWFYRDFSWLRNLAFHELSAHTRELRHMAGHEKARSHEIEYSSARLNEPG